MMSQLLEKPEERSYQYLQISEERQQHYLGTSMNTLNNHHVHTIFHSIPGSSHDRSSEIDSGGFKMQSKQK